MPDGLEIELEVDPRQSEEIRNLLDGIKDGMPKACSTAINKTLPQLRTLAARTVQDELNLKYGDVLHTMSVHKAARDTLSGSVHIKRQPVPLFKYGAKQTAKGVSVQVRRGKGREEIPHLFIATMPNGHTGVFERVPGGHHRRALQFSSGQARKVSTQLPIREKFGPTVVGVLAGKPGMADKLKEQGGEMLAKNLDAQAKWLLEKGQQG